MDLARALAADLRDLSVDLSVDGYTRTTLAMIEHDLRRSVASTLGASITLCTPASPEGPVVVNVVSRTISPSEIEAALRVPLLRLTTPRTGSITFYAARPGAFDRLHPDLAGELHLDPADMELRPPLPTAPVYPKIEGLHDFSLVNRALGVLLNRGHSLDAARATLTEHAERSHTDITSAARAVLDSAHH